MTLEEKLAQLGSSGSSKSLDGDRVEPGKARSAGRTASGRSRAWPAPRASRCPSPPRWPTRSSASSCEETRLGIPAIVHEECLHGLVARDAVCFPQSIGLAAAWDPELVERMADALRAPAARDGRPQGLAPVFDIARDPRWGRIEETYGEDPYLVAALGVAYVRGLQGGPPGDGVSRPASTWSVMACPRAA